MNESINQSVTKMFVEQSLSLPGSADNEGHHGESLENIVVKTRVFKKVLLSFMFEIYWRATVSVHHGPSSGYYDRENLQNTLYS